MGISPKKLEEILVNTGYIEKAEFDKAVERAEKTGVRLETVLVENGLISDSHLGQLIANAYDWRFVDLAKISIPDEVLKYIVIPAAKSQQAIVFEKTDDSLKVATVDPNNYPFIKLLEKTSGLEVEVYYATPSAIIEAIKAYKGDLAGELTRIIENFQNGYHPEESTVKFVNLILEYARDTKVSDIHFEPLHKIVSLRYRIDGVLHEVVQYPKELHEKVVFRIKIMSKLRTDEHLAAQDGRFSYESEDGRFDVRVSILPVTGGENIVMRLLTDSVKHLSLDDVGLEKNDKEKVARAIEKPYGMILTVGPTGSGKTTTLYSLLQILNEPDVNIMTIEDPVEYQIEHVRQTQVNPKKNLTFATGLRSLVRQDPDIIMVGEIRDAETANIAVNIAMTGHLLLSTMHANDASTAFPRLIDMGMESFLVASSLNVVIAQRLVRKICDKCKASWNLDKKEIDWLSTDAVLIENIKKIAKKKDLAKITFFKGAGCKACGGTGYTGRTGVFEVMEIDDDLRTLINRKASADEIARLAIKNGMSTMMEDGIKKALGGVTTLEEVVRSIKS